MDIKVICLVEDYAHPIDAFQVQDFAAFTCAWPVGLECWKRNFDLVPFALFTACNRYFEFGLPRHHVFTVTVE